MTRRPLRSIRTDTLLPYTTLFRSVPLVLLLVVLVCRRGGLLRVGRIDVITERHLALLVDHHLARPGVGHSLAPDDDAHTNATFPFSGLHSGHGCSCGLALLPAITTPLPPHFLQSRDRKSTRLNSSH